MRTTSSRRDPGALIEMVCEMAYPSHSRGCWRKSLWRTPDRPFAAGSRSGAIDLRPGLAARVSWMETRVTKMAGVSARFSKSLGSPSVVPEPGEGAFDYPAARQHHEALRVRAPLDDLQAAATAPLLPQHQDTSALAVARTDPAVTTPGRFLSSTKPAPPRSLGSRGVDDDHRDAGRRP